MNQSLPANFLWGNSVSSMQTEGAWNEGGKGMSVYDIREAGENISDWKVATASRSPGAASARRVTASSTPKASRFTTALSTI